MRYILVALLTLVPKTAFGQGADWLTLDQAMEQATAEGELVFVYVRAPWCGPCYRLEADVLPQIEHALDPYVRAKVDLSDRPDPGLVLDAGAFEWIRAHGLETPPAFAVVSADGSVLASLRGFASADRLRRLLFVARQSVPASSS